MGLTPYLRSVRQAVACLSSSAPQKINVVLGNESCDLDSAVSAVVTGYMLSAKHSQLFVPILNIPREDYALKTEVKFVFEKANITESMLTFLDDFDLLALHQEKRLNVTLVDHNLMTAKLRPIEDAVTEVIDHHVWEANFPNPVEKTVETVGSCTTLVGGRLLEEQPSLVDELIARLLMSTIVTDTAKFRADAKKTTPKDLNVFEDLANILPNVDWKKEYKAIKNAKQSVESMAVRDLLRKDLKMAESVHSEFVIAVPTVPVSKENLLLMPNFDEDIEVFRVRQNAKAVVVVTTKSCGVEGGDLERGLIIYSPDSNLRNSLLNYLKSFSDPPLQLTEMPARKINAVLFNSLSSNEQEPPIHVLSQANLAASRKVILPAIRSFTEEYNKR